MELSENFPAEIGLPARLASFPAIGSSEFTSTLNGTKASSNPDNSMTSLLNDLPSIKEVPEEHRAAKGSGKLIKQERHVSTANTFARSITALLNTTPRAVNHNPRRFRSARFSNCTTKASKLKNNPGKNDLVTDKSKENYN